MQGRDRRTKFPDGWNQGFDSVCELVACQRGCIERSCGFCMFALHAMLQCVPFRQGVVEIVKRRGNPRRGGEHESGDARGGQQPPGLRDAAGSQRRCQGRAGRESHDEQRRGAEHRDRDRDSGGRPRRHATGKRVNPRGQEAPRSDVPRARASRCRLRCRRAREYCVV